MNERIKKLRQELGLSQDEFGRRLGVTRGAITNIELNKVDPKPLFVDLICREFGVSEEWLRTGTGEMWAPVDADQELQDIFAEITFSGDELITRIIKSYWRLSDSEKATIHKLIDGMSEKNTPEE